MCGYTHTVLVHAACDGILEGERQTNREMETGKGRDVERNIERENNRGSYWNRGEGPAHV